MMIRRIFAILALTSAFLSGCSDRPGPTEPRPSPTAARTPDTPTPIGTTATTTATPGFTTTATSRPAVTATATPTPPAPPIPSPTPAGNSLVVTVHLTRMNPPPGARHAVRADMVVTETVGRPATLTGVVTYTFGKGQFVVSGFTTRHLAPYEATSYVLTITTATDVPCADGLSIGVYYNAGTPTHVQNGAYHDCTHGEWLF